MKKLIFTLLIIRFSLLIVHAQTGWFWQNPLPTGNPVRSIKFINPATAYAVGTLGTAIKSTDGGNSWNTLNTNSYYDLNSVFCTDVNTIYAAGSASSANGIVLKSTNGGISWTSTLFTQVVNSLYFTDILTGYAVTINTILKTTNAGTNWNIISTGSGNSLNAIYFPDTNTGYACDYGGFVFKTTNAGVSWTSLSTGSGALLGLYFIDANTGFAVGGFYSGVLLKTINGGSSWTQMVSFNGTTIHDIYFTNSVSGYAVGTQKGGSASFYSTVNGGQTWNFQTVPNFIGGFTSVYFKDLNTGIVVGGESCNSNIAKTTNAGLTFSNQFAGSKLNINSIYFVNSNTGFASGGIDISGSSIILGTINGGANWNIQFTGSGYLGHIFFINSSTGFATGANSSAGLLYKTTNGGLSWNTLSLSAQSFGEIYFPNQNTGYLTASGGGNYPIYKTTDAGINWSIVSTFTNIYSTSIFFTDANTGYATAYGGIIKKTTDGAASWFNQVSNTSQALLSVFMLDVNTGYVSGYNGILYTSNSGTNWNQQLSMSNVYLNDIVFVNSNTGYCVGYTNGPGNGVVLKTTNSGVNWNTQNSNTCHQLYTVFFTDANSGYMGGYTGTILKTTDGGGILTSSGSINITLPKEFHLSQNYPNPFNPSTRIRFEVPLIKGDLGGFVKLTIYDILGQEIATLVNESLKPGSYEVEFNGSNFPSGIYYYKLTAGNFSETRKMVMIK